MLSYQHAYHAGGPADLHKHAALAALLALLARQGRPLTYMESHAGRGVYDLSGPEAAKTGEAARGIARLTPSGPFAEALAKVRKRFGPSAYPGSPLVARALLRPGDRMLLCELHPAEHAALRAAMHRSPPGARYEVHRRDGHEALPALCPPEPRAGLALLDPSYEVKTEYAATARTAAALRRRWPEGRVLIWYPLLPEARHTALVGPLRRAEPGALVDEAPFAERPPRGMTGSGLILLNPPPGAAEALAEARAACAPVLLPPEAPRPPEPPPRAAGTLGHRRPATDGKPS